MDQSWRTKQVQQGLAEMGWQVRQNAILDTHPSNLPICSIEKSNPYQWAIRCFGTTQYVDRQTPCVWSLMTSHADTQRTRAFFAALTSCVDKRQQHIWAEQARQETDYNFY
jgi:hypothetical protein